MAATATFNLIKDGIVGHVNVTIAKGDFSLTLGNSADLSTFPMGIHSPSFEAYRVEASIKLIQKTVPLDDATFNTIKTYFEAVEGNQTHYGLYFGVNCIDFTQQIYEMTGTPGHFADLFSDQELQGPLSGWLMRREKSVHTAVTVTDTIQANVYLAPSPAGEFGISGGIVILAVLLLVIVTNRSIARAGKSTTGVVRRVRALARSAIGG